MLHKNVSNSISAKLPLANDSNLKPNPAGLSLVGMAPIFDAARLDAASGTTSRRTGARSGQASSLLDLAVITSRRCSSFFAEAAVLVLVFGILDYFMLKGRIELPWIVGALSISLGLLGASIAMDFSAQRWIKAHP
jgi:hypothetical protein